MWIALEPVLQSLAKKQKKRLDDYKAAVGPDDNSNEFNGKVLYSMEGGLRHGRVPMGNGFVDNKEVLAAAKSKRVEPSHAAPYQTVMEENEQLRETNQILIEENGVNREFIMRFYADFGKTPPADLVARLASIDARRHQVGSSHSASHAHDMNNNTGNPSDENDESDNDMPSDEGGCNGMRDGEDSTDMEVEDNCDNQDPEE